MMGLNDPCLCRHDASRLRAAQLQLRPVPKAPLTDPVTSGPVRCVQRACLTLSSLWPLVPRMKPDTMDQTLNQNKPRAPHVYTTMGHLSRAACARTLSQIYTIR
jgi:hypothetical protein